MLGFKEEPFITEALDSRTTSLESSALAEGGWSHWTRCCISLVRDAASSSSVEPTVNGGTRDPDSSTGTGFMGYPTMA